VSGPRRFPEGWKPFDHGYLHGVEMEDGRWWCLLELFGGRLRIVIAEDEFTSGEHWCFSDVRAGWMSYFNGPTEAPVGWSRHMLPDGRFERFDQHGELYVDG